MIARPTLLTITVVLALSINLTGAPDAIASRHNVGGPTGSCPVFGRVVKDGSWTWIKPPPPDPEESEGFAWYTVNPSRPDEIYAQPGTPEIPEEGVRSIFFSRDGGCHWQERKMPQLSLHENQYLAGATWKATVIPNRDPGIVYLLLRADLDGFSAPIILASRDQGKSWEELDLSDLGLDAIGGATPVGLHVAPSDPRRLYLSLRVDRNPADTWADQRGDTLYVSKDAGETWDLAYTEPIGALHLSDDVDEPSSWRPVGWRDIAIDPLDPDSLWMVGARGKFLFWDTGTHGGGRPRTQLWHSTDGGSSWKLVDLGGATLDGYNAKTIDIHHRPGERARITVRGDYPDEGLFWSEDGGSTWGIVPEPKNQCGGPAVWRDGGHVSTDKDGPLGGSGTVICAGGNVTFAPGSSSYDIYRLDRRTGEFVSLRIPIDRTEASRLKSLSVNRSPEPTIFVLGEASPGSYWLLKYTPRKG